MSDETLTRAEAERLIHDHVVNTISKALYGMVVASVIFTCVVYALAISARNDDVRACEGRNVTRAELNERGVAIDSILTVLIQARQGPDSILRSEGTALANKQEVADLKASRYKVDSDLPLLDCEEVFPMPWPLG